MKRNFSIILTLYCIMFTAYSLELKKVNEWKQAEVFSTYEFYSTLCDNQVFGYIYENQNTILEEKQLVIKNFLTNEITYTFSPDDKLWGEYYEGYVVDQYGKYIFFQDNGKVKLFDIEKKRFRNSNEILKRSRYVYYLAEKNNKYLIYQYDIITEKHIELRSDDADVNTKLYGILSYLDLDYFSCSSCDKTIYSIDSHDLIFQDNIQYYILQIDENTSKLLDIKELSFIDKEKLEKLLYIDKNYFFAFTTSLYETYIDTMQYEFMILDNNGKILKTFPDIELIRSVELANENINRVFKISKDKRYVLLFDDFNMHVYDFIE